MSEPIPFETVEDERYREPLLRWECPSCGWKMEQVGFPFYSHLRNCPACPQRFLVVVDKGNIRITVYEREEPR